jgi:type IV secretory pathway VirB4 component
MNIFKRRISITDTKKQTAQEFINVVDIIGKILYTKDANLFAYIKIHPISLELLSRKEKERLTRQLTSELSTETKPFKFFAISRPVDISILISDLQDAYINSNDLIQKKLLKENIRTTHEFATTGEVVERQFYVIIWQKEYNGEAKREILKRADELSRKFEACNIRAKVAGQSQIIQLCNLFANPSFGADEQRPKRAGAVNL